MDGFATLAPASIKGVKPPVVVIGAGFAGLIAARELHRHGFDVNVYEGGPTIAGMATSFQDEQGFKYVAGAHFLTNRLTAALGVDADCRDIAYYGESVYLGSRTYSYPFGLLRNRSFLASAVSRRLRTKLTGEATSAAEWFRNTYGDAIAERVALPLCEAWSGAKPETLSAAVGSKLGGIIETFYLSWVRQLTGRAVAIGYTHEKPQSAHVWHVYPKHGVSWLCQRLALELAGRVHTSARVEQVFVDGGTVTGVSVNGEKKPASAIFSTAPVHILARVVSGTDQLIPYRNFRYRGMLAVNLCASGRNLLSDVVLWYPDRSFPFFRLTEAPISMPWLAPEGKTVLTADIGADPGDAWWTMDEKHLAEACLDAIETFIPDIRKRHLGTHVVRLGTAYPVFNLDYESHRQAWASSTGIDGLVSIGRNGEFGHWLMEDVYWRTLRKVRQWMSNQRDRRTTPVA